MPLAHLLDGLRCAECLTPDVLWYDPVHALVQCRECGQRAHVACEDVDELREVV